MEKRSEPHLVLNQPLVLTCWQKEGGTYSGRFVDHSADAIQIKLERSLERGGIVKLETGDQLVIAEVLDCQADDDGYSAGLGILACMEKSELDRLMRETIMAPAPEHGQAEGSIAVAST